MGADRRPVVVERHSDADASETRRLGLRVRELRRMKKLTTRELAQRAGVSASLINQLENGTSGASVVSMRKIAAALEVPIAEFFLEPRGSSDSSVTSVSRNTSNLVRIVRRDQRKRLHVPESNFTFELLTPDLQGSIEFLWFELDPGRAQEESMPHQHPGEECALVLSGTMHLIVGSEEYVLGPGDSVVFDPAIPHRMENRGTMKLIEISAITPPSF
jgi:transcriptional regulator with XRE-family HTH domain